MIKSIYTIFMLFTILACQQNGAMEINAKKLKKLQADGITIIDIRTSEEYKNGHIPGVDLNIDFKGDDFITKMNGLDKNEPIVIHCNSGRRSGRAVPMLIEAGFTTIYDYSGGFSDWVSNGEEVEK